VKQNDNQDKLWICERNRKERKKNAGPGEVGRERKGRESGRGSREKRNWQGKTENGESKSSPQYGVKMYGKDPP